MNKLRLPTPYKNNSRDDRKHEHRSPHKNL